MAHINVGHLVSMKRRTVSASSSQYRIPCETKFGKQAKRINQRLDHQLLANTRMKDYFDLWVLCEHEAFDYALLAQAIRATLERRGTRAPEFETVRNSFGDTSHRDLYHAVRAYLRDAVVACLAREPQHAQRRVVDARHPVLVPDGDPDFMRRLCSQPVYLQRGEQAEDGIGVPEGDLCEWSMLGIFAVGQRVHPPTDPDELSLLCQVAERDTVAFSDP